MLFISLILSFTMEKYIPEGQFIPKNSNNTKLNFRQLHRHGNYQYGLVMIQGICQIVECPYIGAGYRFVLYQEYCQSKKVQDGFCDRGVKEQEKLIKKMLSIAEYVTNSHVLEQKRDQNGYVVFNSLMDIQRIYDKQIQVIKQNKIIIRQSIKQLQQQERGRSHNLIYEKD